MDTNLTAIVRSKPGNSETMKAFLLELVSESIKEPACIQYDLHQSADDENMFIFHEIWKGEDGLDIHNGQPHIKRFGEHVAEIIDGPVVIYKTNKISV
jgi:quinol monooxygenase YgiN